MAWRSKLTVHSRSAVYEITWELSKQGSGSTLWDPGATNWLGDLIILAYNRIIGLLRGIEYFNDLLT